MKKFFLVFFCIFCLLNLEAYAQVIKVQSLDNFSFQKPKKYLRVKTINTEELGGTVIKPNTVISGIVMNTQSAKWGKRDAYAEFIPVYTIYKRKKNNIYNKRLIAKIAVYEKLAPKEVAVNVAKKTAGVVFKGVYQGAQFAKGAIQAQNGQRIKSGAMNVYRDSFLSYVEAGEELNIKAGDILILEIENTR